MSQIRHFIDTGDDPDSGGYFRSKTPAGIQFPGENTAQALETYRPDRLELWKSRP